MSEVRTPVVPETSPLTAVPAALAGSVSVWCGPVGGPPAYARDPDRAYYAASVVKLAVLAALYRAARCGLLDLDEQLPVTDRFASLAGPDFVADRAYDNDEQPWQLLGSSATLRWLGRRMIVSSSNLAANLLVQHLGLATIAAACPAGMRIERQIGDADAERAGHTNTVTAAAVAALLADMADDDDMLAELRAQQHRDGIASGLPPDAVLGAKGGWVDGIRHDCAVISPPDAPSYVLTVCTSGLPDADALALIGSCASASWTRACTC